MEARNADLADRIKSRIGEFPDFPKKGVSFKDINGLLASNGIFHEAIKELADKIPEKPDFIAGIESRGFIIGIALALEIGVGFVPIRKAGKLPGELISEKYNLEYGTATIELQKNAMPKGSKVVIADDLLATGGTSKAAYNLILKQGSFPICFAFIIQLTNLNGEKRLPIPVFSIAKY
ncbi:MAG: adenine phosphoribosyltransferase [Candidatus Marsarchaeota archaeon]|nr:adenine phosphoribosyltransferase [Candidatus Marsarchaeota archaeon]MCL5102230.1 adenine phosphoribosyltransferase [Candidatus Marsarchaeota archaeon]